MRLVPSRGFADTGLIVLAFLAGHQESDRTVSLKNVSCKHERINPQAGRNWLRKPAATQHGPGEVTEKWMMGDVIKGSVSYSESIPDAKMGYLTGQIGGRDASISQGIIFSSSVILIPPKAVTRQAPSMGAAMPSIPAAKVSQRLIALPTLIALAGNLRQSRGLGCSSSWKSTRRRHRLGPWTRWAVVCASGMLQWLFSWLSL